MITPLGQVGFAEDTNVASLAVPLTTDVPASDATTNRVVVLWLIATSEDTGDTTAFVFDTVFDDATLTAPNACYGANGYVPFGGFSFGATATYDVGLDKTFKAMMAWSVAETWQPLAVGDSVVATSPVLFDWARGYLFAYEGAVTPTYAIGTNPLDETITAGCSSQMSVAAFPVDTGWGVLGMSTFFQSNDSITLTEAALFSDPIIEFYDQGPQNASVYMAEGVVTDADDPIDMGGCANFADLSLVMHLGHGFLLSEGDGLPPCSGSLEGTVKFEPGDPISTMMDSPEDTAYPGLLGSGRYGRD